MTGAVLLLKSIILTTVGCEGWIGGRGGDWGKSRREPNLLERGLGKMNRDNGPLRDSMSEISRVGVFFLIFKGFFFFVPLFIVIFYFTGSVTQHLFLSKFRLHQATELGEKIVIGLGGFKK